MKRVLISFALVGLGWARSFAAIPVLEQPITARGTGTTVSVSISAWTKVPASSSIDGRSGLLVNNPATNTARMLGILGGCTVSPTEATTVGPLEFAPSTDFSYIPVSNAVCLYLISLNGSAENVHVQEVRQ
jgi:hypothetical protein